MEKMVEPTVVSVRKIADVMDWNTKGFPFLIMDKKVSIYIPLDKKAWFTHGIKGSIVKGEKNYTIKKGSENIVYVVYVKVEHDKTVKVENLNVTVDGDVVNELNYDDFSSKFFTYIVRVIEVSPNSTVKVEFDVEGKHHTVLYTKDGVETFEN